MLSQLALLYRKIILWNGTSDETIVFGINVDKDQEMVWGVKGKTSPDRACVEKGLRVMK